MIEVNGHELLDQMKRPRKSSTISTRSRSAFGFACSDIALLIAENFAHLSNLGAMVLDPVQDHLTKRQCDITWRSISQIEMAASGEKP